MNNDTGITIHEDETLDGIFQGKLQVIQKKNGYRFSMDAVLVARATTVTAEDRVIDLGTGCGIIPLILARSGRGKEIVGIEFQGELTEIARRNVDLNGLAKAITIRQEDVRQFASSYLPASFDCVISNPPFRKLATGRINPGRQKSVARHEITITLDEVLKAAAYLLKRHGRLCLIYPAFRAVDLFSMMRQTMIEPKIIRWVHARKDMPARMVLVEGIKAGGVALQVREPLILYDETGAYTEALRAIYSLP